MNITIIGGGNMGEALIKGLRGQKVFVCESDAKRVAYLKKKYKIIPAGIADAVKNAATIIFAVKPQDMEAVLAMVSVAIPKSKSPLFISIAAGLTTKFFEQYLVPKARVIRAMPNMPALIGEGITGLCAGRFATGADVKTAQRILLSVGETVVVKESMINAVTAVSGSGPAYVFLFVEQWMRAAKHLGFTPKESKALVYKTLLGSAHLLMKSDIDAGALRVKVTSKGGTTQAALDVFYKGKFDKLIDRALLAAQKRAVQLAR